MTSNGNCSGPEKLPAPRPAPPKNPNADPLVASLRAAYDKTLAEPLPPALADLLRRLQ